MLHTKLFVSRSPTDRGELYTAGNNNSYRTAQGTSTGQTQVMTKVGNLYTWKRVQCCETAMILLRSDGTLWTIGSNADGITGQGTTTGTLSVLTQIGSATDWVYVSARVSVALAIKSNGTLWVWGTNAEYVTGLNTNTGFTTTPTQLGADTDWMTAAAGSRLCAAIKTDGRLYSWGSNSGGATGRGLTAGNTMVPTQVGTDTDWVSVSCSLYTMQIIKNTGTLWGCGQGSYGNLGLGSSPTEYSTPTQMGTDSDWSKVVTGYRTSIMLKTNGTIYSCGINNAGATGQNLSTGNIYTATQIGTDSDWRDMSILGNGNGNVQVFAIKGRGELWAWGINNAYQLGLGDTTSRLVPTRVGTESDWIKVSAGNVFGGAIQLPFP